MIYNVPVWDMTGAHKKSITVSIKLKYYFERAPQVRPRVLVLDRANLSAERRCSWGCGVSEDNIEGWGGCNWEWSTLLIVTNSDPVTLSHHNSGGTLYKTTNLRIIGIMMGDTLTHSHKADIQHTIILDDRLSMILINAVFVRCGVICPCGWQVVSIWLRRYGVCKWWCLMYSERDSRDNIPVTPVTTLPGTHLALSTYTALSHDRASQSELSLAARTNQRRGSLTYEWQWL